jgi:myosin heavy subunit
MDSNPILEAFGNAKTVRNDNSSRFGKLIEIKFSKDGKILGATIKSYLLEKSRVVQLQEGEQNFKIFYQLILGKDEEEEKKYKIKPLEYYKYLKNEKNIENEENIKYKDDFLNTKKCLKNFNFSPDEIDNLFKILSGILYLGNIEFIKKDNQKYLDIDDKSKEDLQNASIFFGLEVDVLKRILTRKKNPNYEGPDPYEPYDIEKAENIRDSIAKELYSELFKFIIDKKINPKIKNGDDNKDGDNNKKDDNNNYIISILDIFGFENFKENSFEQLCINYSNEKLQQYFIKEIFKAEQKLYDDEGINYDKIEYKDKDNEEIIKLIGRRKGGPSIFGLLEEVYRLKDEKVKDKDKKFREKVYDEFFKKNLKKIRYKDTEDNGLLEYRYKEEYSLNIHHYAGIVRYNVKGMVKKNILESNNDLIKEFEKKDIKNRLIFEIFKDEKKMKKKMKKKMIKLKAKLMAL